MTPDQAIAMVQAIDEAARKLRKAREATFTAFGSVSGVRYRAIEDALLHIDRARIALRRIVG